VSGLFITFEGPDGAGKTTQVHNLAEVMQSKGYDVLVTREPGGTDIGDKIRELVLNPKHKEMFDHTEVLLYAASRAQHVKEKIMPALQSGKIVICDRFVDASIAYQGYGLGFPIETVESINRFATAGLVPDRTYMLDLSVQEAQVRLRQREGLDRIERRGADYHERVRAGFAEIAKRHPERVRVVAANRPIEQVSQEIARDMLNWLHRLT
jgi:dTMP kinase